jgi:FemAB-related protein (PEP-CTERM system-associated)
VAIRTDPIASPDVAARALTAPEPGLGVDVALADDAAAWDAYVEGQPGATIHHLFAWKTVAEQAYSLRAPFLVARDASRGPGAPIRGVLPLIHVPRPFTAYLTSGLFGSYGPLLADDERHARALVSAATRRVDAGEARSLHLKLLGDLPAGVPPVRQDVWVTARLDLGPDEKTLLARLPRRQRWAVRHAVGTPLEVSRGANDFDGFYEVLFQNMRRKGAPIYGRRFFLAALRALGSRADVITLKHRGRVVSGAFIAFHHGVMYVPFSSSLPDYFKLRVNDILYWEVIRRAREQGCGTLDFGSSLLGSSVLAFKLKWGARVEPIGSYVYAAGNAKPKLDPRGSRVAAVVVRAWARLPAAVARVLGPRLCRWIA